MNLAKLSSAAPWALALVALVLLGWWRNVGPSQPLEKRVPGMDRAGGSGGAADVNAGAKLTQFDGKPADLPGTWPGFRGPTLDGIAADVPPLARKWAPGGPPVLWSIELGEGYAGAAVRNGRVYVLDYERNGAADALRCLSLGDGKEIWRFTYPVSVKRNHGMSRTTPAVTDHYVVTLGPKCHVACVDAASGEKKWLIDLVREYRATVPQWYAGQCPLIDGSRVLLAPGGDSLLIAVDLPTGRVLWKTPNPNGWTMTHSSIVPMDVGGKRTYVYCGKGGVVGVLADDGRILWETSDWKITIATVPSPVVLPGERLFFSGGYSTGALLLQVNKDGEKWSARTVRRLEPGKFGSTQQTPIFYDGYLYGIREKDKQLVCMKPDGTQVWTSGSQHRFGLGPYLVADKLLYVLDDNGNLTLADASPAGYQQLDHAAVIDGHDSWAPMALAGGRLLLRDLVRMVCVDVSKK